MSVHPEICGNNSHPTIERVEEKGYEGQPAVQPCGIVKHFRPEEHRDGKEEVKLFQLVERGGSEGLHGQEGVREV